MKIFHLTLILVLGLQYSAISQLQCLASNSTSISALNACGQSFSGKVTTDTSYVNTYNCVSGNNWIGGESIFLFKDVVAGIYTFTIGGFATDLDLFVLSSCSATSCLSANGARGRSGRSESVTITLNDGQSVYLVVDGKFKANAVFWLDVKCNNKICEQSDYISCGAVISASTGSFGSTDLISNHTSCGASGYHGYEHNYRLSSSQSPITIDLLPSHGSDLDLFVYDECKSSLQNCLAAGNKSPWGESVYLASGVNGNEGYIVVDGRSDYGHYEIAVTCGSPCDSRPIKIGCSTVINSSTVGKSNNASYYSCDPFSDKGHNWGPDEVYEIELKETRELEISLEMANHSDLNLYLLKSNCDPTSCIAASKRNGKGYGEWIKQKLTRGKYFLVVDGYRGDASAYTLSVSGCGCNIEGALKCGVTTHGTVRQGSNNVTKIEGECFTKEVLLPSEDVTYAFTAENDGHYSFILSELKGGLDLFVMKECDESQSCVEGSTKSGNATEIVNVQMKSGEQVFVLVDGIINATNTDFKLEVMCGNNRPAPIPDVDADEEPESGDDVIDFVGEIDTIAFSSCGIVVNGTTKNKTSKMGRFDYSCFRSSLDFKGGDQVVEFYKQSSEEVLTVHMFHGNTSLENLSMFIFDSTFNEVANCKGLNFRNDKTIGNGNVIGEYYTDIKDKLPVGKYYAVIDGFNSRVESNFSVSTTCSLIDCNEIVGLPCVDSLQSMSTLGSSNNESIYYSDDHIYVGYSGGETVLSFCIDSTTDLDISLTEIVPKDATIGDLDLFLVENVCSDTKRVIAASTNEDTLDENIQIKLESGEYFVVVDGWNGSKGSFKIRNKLCLESACGKSKKALQKISSDSPKDIQLSPNPFTDQVYLDYQSTSPSFEISIFDGTGKLISNRLLERGKHEISDMFPRSQMGLFYIQINDQGRTRSRSLIRI